MCLLHGARQRPGRSLPAGTRLILHPKDDSESIFTSCDAKLMELVFVLDDKGNRMGCGCTLDCEGPYWGLSLNNLGPAPQQLNKLAGIPEQYVPPLPIFPQNEAHNFCLSSKQPIKFSQKSAKLELPVMQLMSVEGPARKNISPCSTKHHRGQVSTVKILALQQQGACVSPLPRKSQDRIQNSLSLKFPFKNFSLISAYKLW